MRDMIRNAFSVLRSGRMVAIHLVGNAALIAAGALWLLIGEAHIVQLIFAAVAALAILFLTLWLHTSTFNYAADPSPENFRSSFRISALRMFWLFLGMAIILWLMRYMNTWQEHDIELSGYLYAKSPEFLRPVSGESAYQDWIDRLFAILYWWVLPGLFLPIIAARIIGARVRSGLETLLQWRYWLAMAVAIGVGVWVPKLLIGWVPFKKLGAEMASLTARFSAAYFLTTAAWLVVVGLLGYCVRLNSEHVRGDTVA